MNRKIFLFVACFLMMIVGLLRGSGGAALMMKGNRLDVNNTIVASENEVLIAAVGLMVICVVFMVTSVVLIAKRTVSTWNFAWLAIGLFLLGGIMNGYLLFGKPIDRGQSINFAASFLIGFFLFLGKPALKTDTNLPKV